MVVVRDVDARLVAAARQAPSAHGVVEVVRVRGINGHAELVSQVAAPRIAGKLAGRVRHDLLGLLRPMASSPRTERPCCLWVSLLSFPSLKDGEEVRWKAWAAARNMARLSAAAVWLDENGLVSVRGGTPLDGSGLVSGRRAVWLDENGLVSARAAFWTETSPLSPSERPVALRRAHYRQATDQGGDKNEPERAPHEGSPRISGEKFRAAHFS